MTNLCGPLRTAPIPVRGKDPIMSRFGEPHFAPPDTHQELLMSRFGEVLTAVLPDGGNL